MPRDLDALAGHAYDVLVIGGGIHGLFAAYDAAQRGLRVVLVDRADFGSGLSFNHQRTIHGGLRALERARALKARKQIAERRTWALIAPHLLRPLPFLIGTYRFSRRSRLLVRAGFKLYDAVGRNRNRGVTPELHLPRAKLESAAATRRLFAGIAEAGLTGGAVWYDYQIVHPDRLTWTVALAAERAGATLANYVDAIAPLESGGRVGGARVRDLATGQEHDVRATVTILAPGGALPVAMAMFGAPGAPPMLRAMNLLLDRPAKDIATVAPGPSGRMFTAVPWSRHVLVGTHQSASPVDGPDATPPAEAIDAFLAEANAAFPKLQAARSEIRLVHHGLTPAVVRNGRADLMPESRVLRDGRGGLLTVVGVKYTTARLTAATAVDLACRDLPTARGRSRTAHAALPHADVADAEGRLIETTRELGLDVERDVIEHLTGWYGTEARDVVTFAAHEGLLERLVPHLPILAGEIAYAAVHAQALHLSDAVMRRTPLGSAGHPGRPALERAAGILAPRLAWSNERTAAEIRTVESTYGAAPGGAAEPTAR
jgi:glycerol-3-phosphate dehydrogenase